MSVSYSIRYVLYLSEYERQQASGKSSRVLCTVWAALDFVSVAVIFEFFLVGIFIKIAVNEP